eukprot:NODE_7045_length_1614_cov_5.226631.p1 GENE.NODE_7045_length_1614_cov_5.226631~~NODE_7045_length_1614_cov_5.226631.p1  ORF type:complete len:388 (-),score=109.17 NODE_7045_length_1614_cov_5.226631:39-1202(-)
MTRPENKEMWWTHQKYIGDELGNVSLEFCLYSPSACQQDAMCAEGHTGRQCLTCLPGYFRYSDGLCKKCTAKAWNASMLLLQVSAVIVTGFALAVITSSGDNSIAMLKQILTHCITMAFYRQILASVFAEQHTEDNHSLISVCEWLLVLLDLGDGMFPTETVFWSMTCLSAVQESSTDVAYFASLSNATQSSYLSPALREARIALRDNLQASMFSSMIITFTVCGIIVHLITHLIGAIKLSQEIEANGELYSDTMELFHEVLVTSVQAARKKHLTSHWRAMLDSYQRRVWGIWRPIVHVAQVRAGLLTCFRMFSVWQFLREFTPVSLVIAWLVHMRLLRSALEPLHLIPFTASNDDPTEYVIRSHPVLGKKKKKKKKKKTLKKKKQQ